MAHDMTSAANWSAGSAILPRLRWRMGNVQLAFSTVEEGDQRHAALRQTWLKSLGLVVGVVPRQIHGTKIVDAGDTQGLLLADGVVSDDSAIALGVYGADCPGLCLVAGSIMGVAHCGWRGVAGGIVEKLFAEIARRTTIPVSDWCGFIGPGISTQNYEVDAPVLSARRWPTTAVIPGRPDHAWLNVADVIAHDLNHLGITHIMHSNVCTADDPRLWSYRKQGPGLVQALMAWRVTD
jgi:polyphenol oxidase